MFSDAYFNTYNFPAFLKSAIYSRQSFLLHSDARETNTPVKLYIEEACQEIAIPILQKNNLNIETDVLWFETPPLENKMIWARLSKKLCLYWDKQLTKYERVIYWDADMFKIPCTFKEIFARINSVTPRPTFLRVNYMQRRRWRPDMIRASVKNTRYVKMPIQEIFDKAELGRVLQNIQGHLVKPIGGFCVYPAQEFNNKHQDFLNWLQTHAPYIGDDEICIALAAHKYNIFLNSFSPKWTFVSIYDYLSGDKEHTFLHGKSESPQYKQILIDFTLDSQE